MCPDNEGRSNGEYLTIYEVTEFARDECALESNKREVVRCGVETNAEKLIRSHQLPVLNPKQPIPPKNVAQFIRPVNPIPNGKEYQPGLTYYFISEFLLFLFHFLFLIFQQPQMEKPVELTRKCTAFVNLITCVSQ